MELIAKMARPKPSKEWGRHRGYERDLECGEILKPLTIEVSIDGLF